MTREGHWVIWSVIGLMCVALAVIVNVHVNNRIDIACNGEFWGRRDDAVPIHLTQKLRIVERTGELQITGLLSTQEDILVPICNRIGGITSFSMTCGATPKMDFFGSYDAQLNRLAMTFRSDRENDGKSLLIGGFSCKKP